MRTVKVVAPRPEEAPEGWQIHNAPRPLFGTRTWVGTFIHGIFYAAIDPADEYAQTWIKENSSLDAYNLEFVERECAIQTAYAFYQEHYPQTISWIDLSDSDVVAMMLTGWLRAVNK